MRPGVYRFRDAGGCVLYVGRATTLRSRVASYWSDLRDRGHLGPMLARVARIQAVACDSVHEAAWLERNLLETSLSRWNRTPGGQESAVYIRMDTRPAALDWVTCPQRVTSMDPASYTASGWCSGILVQFQISSGRVCRWSQRTCSMPGVARALAATPHAWGDFMQRTAELAAKMTHPASGRRTASTADPR